MNNPHQPLLGALLILASGLLLAINDGLSKYLTQLYPVILVVWVRYLAQTLLMVALFTPRMGRRVFVTLRPWPQLFRGMSLVAVSILFISGLRYIPLAEATAVIFLAPLMVTLASALLGERVSRSQWIAVVFSLMGVLLIVRPGSSLFTLAILLPFGAALSLSIYQLLTRRLAGTDHPVTSNFLASLVGTTVLSVLVLFNWRTPTMPDAGLMVGLGCVTTLGHLLLTNAYRFASAATLAPFTYGQIVFAGIVGFIAFDQAPDIGAMLGIGMIIVSGLGIAYIQGRASPSQ
ncbi:DMT family transporter [Pseudomonas sp. FME51]|uniref:DMT family transporter n=1 Tax=Pseudomonas sp. FME51 TaxID=2742609 RepID=UPI0018662217|nr:DMT family transporter [Pseudomonas sp. FME51]